MDDLHSFVPEQMFCSTQPWYSVSSEKYSLPSLPYKSVLSQVLFSFCFLESSRLACATQCNW